MVVQAKDGAGHPLSGVAITWGITQGGGTLTNPSPVTDANGFASAGFTATSLFGISFQASTVTASSAFGSVNFIITTALENLGLGFSASFIKPVSGSGLTGRSGSTLPGAVVVQVLATQGPQQGLPIPNVGLRIVNADDTTSPASAACNGPNGLVLTDSNGFATCDLLITGQAGTKYLRAYVGEALIGFPFPLQISAGASCVSSLSATSSQQFAVAGGTGTVNVTTGAGCSWSAASNANWITVNSGTSGTGNGAVSYSVMANSGSARTGTLTIAGQTYSISQSGATGGSTGGAVTITTTNLLSGPANVFYSAQLSATGGRPPYTWSVTGTLPVGLSLTASNGAISGTPTTPGTYNFTATANDSTGTASQPQNLSIAINANTFSSFAITTASFPIGAVGQPYQQTITTVNANSCERISSPVSFTVSAGALPSGLTIPDVGSTVAGTPTLPGTFPFTLTATSVCGNTASANLSITITGTAPQMTATPTTLAFTVQQGPNSIPADQQVAIASSGAVLSYTAVVSTNSGGNWLTLRSSTSATTPGSITAGVVNFSNLAPGAYTGVIDISSQASNSPVAVAVNLTVLAAPPVVASPNAFTLDQFASTGSNIVRRPISVTSGSASTHFTVSATSSGGQWLSVSPTDGTTPTTVTAAIDSSGLATSVYTGSILLTPASGAPQTISVTLVVSQQPPSIGSVVNAASFLPGQPVAPGEIVSIFGSAMGPASGLGLQLTTAGTVATNLGSTRVLFDGVSAPILYASASQVSAVVPYEVAGNAATNVQVAYLGLLSNPQAIQVTDSAPGIFTANSMGVGQGDILNQDGSVNSTAHGADPGSVISIFATGEGQTNPPGIDGSINATSLPLPAPRLAVTVQIAGQASDVKYYGAAPGELAGVLQVNAVVPASVQRGTSVPVVITVGSASSQTAMLAIKP